MRLPLLLLLLPCLAFSVLLWNEAGWRWVVVFAVVWTSVFLLVEWIVDTMVKELRKVRLRG